MLARLSEFCNLRSKSCGDSAECNVEFIGSVESENIYVKNIVVKQRKKEQVWGIPTPYPEAEWIFSPESIMPPRPIERSSRAKGA